jgi:hypothetical protein
MLTVIIQSYKQLQRCVLAEVVHQQVQKQKKQERALRPEI